MKNTTRILIVALMMSSLGNLNSAGQSPGNQSPGSAPDLSNFDFPPPPTMPESILAIIEGRKETLHLQPVRIVAEKKEGLSVPELKVRLARTDSTTDPVRPAGILRNQKLKYGTDLFSLGRLCADHNLLPTVTIDTFEGENVEVELQSYESIGLTGGVFIGQIKGDQGSLVSLLFTGRDYQHVTIFPSNGNVVEIKSDTDGWQTVSEVNEASRILECANQ